MKKYLIQFMEQFVDNGDTVNAMFEMHDDYQPEYELYIWNVSRL